MSYVWGQLFTCPQPRILFWFTSSGFCKQPVLFEVLAPTSIFPWGNHMQREYCKRTTLPSKSSTIKGLTYAPDPDKRGKGTLSNQPRLLHVTSTALLCCWGCSRQRYYVLRDWLWDACHMAGVRWGSRCKGFCSQEGPHYCLEQSTRKLS